MTSEAISKSVEEGLRQNFLFEHLEDDEVQGLVSCVSVEEFQDGDVIVRKGDPAESLYLVLDGAVTVTSGGQFLAMLGPQGFFGEMGLFTEGGRRSADCTAHAPTVCACLDRDGLRAYCDDNPRAGLKIYRAIIATLSQRLWATSADLSTLMSTQVMPQDSISKLVDKARGK